MRKLSLLSDKSAIPNYFSSVSKSRGQTYKHINGRSYGASSLTFYHDSPSQRRSGWHEVEQSRHSQKLNLSFWIKTTTSCETLKEPFTQVTIKQNIALCHPECQAWLKQYITRTRVLPNCKDKWHCFETTERKKDSETRNKERAEDRMGEEILSVHQEQLGCFHTRASAAAPSSFEVTIWLVWSMGQNLQIYLIYP